MRQGKSNGSKVILPPDGGIVALQVKGYRSLADLSIRLGSFHVLVGPNASGKSNFLDAIVFVRDLVATNLDAAIRGDARFGVPYRASHAAQLAWMGKEKENEIQIALTFALPRKLRGDHAFARYEISIRVESNESFPRIWLENLWLLKTNDALPNEVCRLPRKRAPVGWKKVIGRTDIEKVHFRSETTQWQFPFLVSAQRTALASLPEDQERFPAALWVRRYLLSGVRRIALSFEAMRMPSPPIQSDHLLPDGRNLPHLVRRLKQASPERFRRWIAHLKEALPELEDIEVVEREEDRHLYLVLSEANGFRVPSYLASDGTLRLLALTLLAYAPEGAPILNLIEEPENGIHPKAIEIVMQSLRSVYQGQVFLATHSPLIVGLAEVDDLLCFSKDEMNRTKVIVGREHEALRQWKQKPLEFLFAAGIL